MKRFLYVFFLAALWIGVQTRVMEGAGTPFIPNVKIMPLEQVREGMTGKALTVIRGQKVVSFPVTVLSILPSEETPRHLVLIRAEGPVIEETGGIAAGMSGSPVFIDGKLLGAIGYGWNFSEHDRGLVTPIEDMMDVWNWPDKILDLQGLALPEKQNSSDLPAGSPGTETKKLRTAPVLISGLSNRAAENIGKNLEGPYQVLPPSAHLQNLPVKMNARLQPGSAVSALVAWGDVLVSATGTLTALSDDGRFLAFAHPFMSRGAVSFPLAEAWVHDVIPSLQAPFKIGTPLSIVGTITQDRPQGIAGQIGRFAPTVDVSVKLKDVDAAREETKRFHMVYDPYLVSDIFPDLIMGLVDNTWGQKREGTARIAFEVEGGGLVSGWQRTNMFYSEKDIAKDMLRETSDLVKAVTLNPFREIIPLGLHIEAEVTHRPRVLLIEDISVPENPLKPGDTFEVKVTLQPYREKAEERTFTLTVPDDTQGLCEVVVRGGGINEPVQESLLEGRRTIKSLEGLLEEINAMERNNEVIVELKCDGGPKPPWETQPEERDYRLLSEIKKDKMEKGIMRVFQSNYYVDGLLRRDIQVVADQAAKKEAL
jgi:hypothetical protein